MERRLIAGLIVIGLAIGIWLVWPRGDAPGATSTSASAAGTSTTSSTVPAAPPTIAPNPSTTTTSVTGDVVETVEEAEAILRELWFGWFEGIYNQDEDRIREVVATEEQVQAAVDQFGVMEFDVAPSIDSVMLTDGELLLTDDQCLAVWAHLDVSAFRADAVGSQGVYVLRQADGHWYLLSVWPQKGDLWEADCESVFSPLP